MKRSFKIWLTVWIAVLMISCKEEKSIIISNPLKIDRSNETVEVSLAELGLTNVSSLVIKDKATGEEVRSQLIDADGNQKPESIIFQPLIGAEESKTYIVSQGRSGLGKSEISTHAVHVPWRQDDFAWESDRVAFRMYGPEGQRMAEDSIKGGTLSSGVDCWLKRVTYPVVDKWYEEARTKVSSYHEDTGEGHDSYHVGPSRGCGGTGVYLDSTLYTSKNWTKYVIQANGPIRSQFVLSYEDWQAGDKTIQESKSISIDLGSDLTRHEVTVGGIYVLTVGLTLHDQKGEIKTDPKNGWFIYTTSHKDAELSTAIVIDPKYYLSHDVIRSEVKDKSHLFVHLKVLNDKVIYRSGFAWSKSGLFSDWEAWEASLSKVRDCVSNPLEVSLSK